MAIVFGEERRGLSDAELTLCQAACTIPTCAAYDSMNLAQAVAVMAYELRLAQTPAAHRGWAGGGASRRGTRRWRRSGHGSRPCSDRLAT